MRRCRPGRAMILHDTVHERPAIPARETRIDQTWKRLFSAILGIGRWLMSAALQARGSARSATFLISRHTPTDSRPVSVTCCIIRQRWLMLRGIAPRQKLRERVGHAEMANVGSAPIEQSLWDAHCHTTCGLGNRQLSSSGSPLRAAARRKAVPKRRGSCTGRSHLAASLSAVRSSMWVRKV